VTIVFTAWNFGPKKSRISPREWSRERHCSSSFDRFSRSGEEAGTRTTRIFWRTVRPVAEGLSAIALGRWNLRRASIRSPAAHSLGRPAINAARESSDRAPGGPLLNVDVYDAAGDCGLRGTDNMQMRFASDLPPRELCAEGNGPVRTFAVHSRGAAPRSVAGLPD
jgi:hypothetical protein